MINILGVGDNVVDKYLHLGIMFPGGQGMNIPINSKILEHMGLSPQPVRAGFIGVVGTDRAGDHIKNTLKEFDVDISRCRTVPGESGQACITLVDGDRHFSGSNKGGVHRTSPLRLCDDDLLYIKTFDVVHTSNNSYFDCEVPKLSSCGVPVSYDFSNTYEEPRLIGICPHIKFGFFSCSGMAEEKIRELLIRANNLGCLYPVATRGGDPPIFYDGVAFHTGTVKPTTPVDTLGAGDAFAAGVLVYLTHISVRSNKSLPFTAVDISEAMNLGALLAYNTCQYHGAFGHGAPIE